MKGIELSKKFFNEYCFEKLNNRAPHLLNKINVGLVGEGSECFFLDDEISKDHDFDKGFAIFIEEKYYKKYKELLEDIYRDFFDGNYVQNNRKGIICTEDFYEKYTNKRYTPISNVDFLKIRESYLSVATNGEIFYGRENLFMDMREYYKKFYPEDVVYKKLAAYLFQMAQAGQYNLFRSLKRRDKISVFFSKNDFIKNEDYYSKMKSFNSLCERTKKQIVELQHRITVIEDWHKLINESMFFHLMNENILIKVKYHEGLDVIKYDMDFDFDYKTLILSVDFANYVKKNNTIITDSVMAYFPSYKRRIKDECENKITPMICIQKTVSEIEKKENSTRIEEGYYLSTYYVGRYKNIINAYKRAEDYAKAKGYVLYKGSIERFVLDYWTTTNEDEFVTEILIPIKNYKKGKD